MVNARLKSPLSQPAGAPGSGAENTDDPALFRISADGTWFYRGSAIQRPEMVKLFASALRHEHGGFMLVTPYERHTVVVDDAPFVAVAMRIEGWEEDSRRLVFTTNIGRDVVLSREHPLIVRGTADEPRPYLVVDSGIEARIARSVYYELAALVEEAGDDSRPDSPLGITSDGAFFALAPEAGKA
jgi:uncharacterized protein